MNIVLINSIGRHKWGGGEKWMIMAASGLQSLGHNVVVVCRKNSILSARAMAQNIPVKLIGANSDFDLLACFRFCTFFRKFNPEVVIGCQNKDWRVASLALKITGNITKVYSRQGLQLLKNSWWYKFSIKLFSHGIITNTQTIKNYYDSFLPVSKDFVKVIFNGVEPAASDVKAFNYSQYISHEVKKPVIVLSTGRLARQKGFGYLIDAAAGIIKENPQVYFFLAGHGKLRGELHERVKKLGIEKNFIFLGFIENIHSLLKGADIFVFSSLYEGMPNSILEAMAYGLPVISTNVNGVTELIQDGKNGQTVEPADVAGLQKSLDCLIKDAEKRKILGNNAKNVVTQKFSVDRMITELDSLISACL